MEFTQATSRLHIRNKHKHLQQPYKDYSGWLKSAPGQSAWSQGLKRVAELTSSHHRVDSDVEGLLLGISAADLEWSDDEEEKGEQK